MGNTCMCQQRISEDYQFEDPQAEDKNLHKKSIVDQHEDKIQREKHDHQKDQQTVDIDPIQLKSYEIEDNRPQGLKPLTIEAQEEFFDQYPVVVKQMIQKLPKLEIEANLSPNYKRIPNIDTHYQLLSGDVYVGQWVEGKPYGLGKIYYIDQSVYEGQVVDGIPDGEGRKIFKDGSIYTGQFKMGDITGKGKFVQFNNGFEYKGEFLCGKPDGIGKETWPDQTTYQGQYKMGKKNGRGTFIWGNRKSQKTGKEESFIGDFQNDLFHGVGRYEWPDGRIYDGEWVEGKMEGKGEFIWQDKRKYIGSYLKDLKSGHGVLEWPNGKNLAGTWRMGKLNGIAVLTIKGKVLEGQNKPEPDRIFLSEWEDGKRIKWINNLSPSPIYSNISYHRNFDERSSQFQQSQYKQDGRKNNNKRQIKTIFQSDNFNIPSEKIDSQFQQTQKQIEQQQQQQSFNINSDSQENQLQKQPYDIIEKNEQELNQNRKEKQIQIHEEQKFDQT
ncbi:unnamed protein product [Paramecium sonneborni]|uniref:MORN repeat protein n=1 Tax=Paramecium sonneborni TaxID=65129 RepID=A0A8S1Q857_9CILI|nr:unnamed protein product [Paramecium sonneborni]